MPLIKELLLLKNLFVFDESNISSPKKVDCDDFVEFETNLEDSSNYKEKDQPSEENKEDEQPILPPQEEGGNNNNLLREWKFVHNHPKDLILRDPAKGVTTGSSIRNICGNLAFLS